VWNAVTKPLHVDQGHHICGVMHSLWIQSYSQSPTVHHNEQPKSNSAAALLQRFIGHDG
jgi:hypothetical protein